MVVKAVGPVPLLVNVISGGLTLSFTIKEVEEMGAKIISAFFLLVVPWRLMWWLVFSLVLAVAVHGIRAAMHSLKKTGSDFTSAQGMDPRAFFELM